MPVGHWQCQGRHAGGKRAPRMSWLFHGERRCPPRSLQPWLCQARTLARAGRRDRDEPSNPALGTGVECRKSSGSVVLPSAGVFRGGLSPCRSLLAAIVQRVPWLRGTTEPHGSPRLGNQPPTCQDEARPASSHFLAACALSSAVAGGGMQCGTVDVLMFLMLLMSSLLLDVTSQPTPRAGPGAAPNSWESPRSSLLSCS